ncbi:hypothetical protein BDF19DRAFT_438461 [Syncephalis fuscata]|nr:hypothetical protein BDF19DRAFT_438461 [Syncephalis fuscata]
MMLFGTKYFLLLLVLLSVDQNISASPVIFTKKEVDPVFKYELNQPGAFKIKGLTIPLKAELKANAYVMDGKYSNGYINDAKVICRNKETDSWLFNLYNSEFPPHSFYSIIEKFTWDGGYLCYMTVVPKCGEKFVSYLARAAVSRDLAEAKFLDLIEIIRESKQKGWSISDAVKYNTCITDDRIVFDSIDFVRPIKTLFYSIGKRVNDDGIKIANDKLWNSLATFYQLIKTKLSLDQAFEYVKTKYVDLEIPTINPPDYKQMPATNPSKHQQMPATNPPPYKQ